MCTTTAVLTVISLMPGTTTGEIAAILETDMATVSKKVSRLVLQGRIRREPADLTGVARTTGYRLWVVE